MRRHPDERACAYGRTVLVYPGTAIPSRSEDYASSSQAERAAATFNASGELPTPLELEAVSDADA